MAAVDVAHERRADVVPEQLLQRSGSRAHDVAGHGQEVVLLGPEPRRHVLEDHAQAGPVGGVGPAAVPHAAQVEQHRSRRHLRRHGGGVRVGLLAGPAVAPGDDAGGPVGLGEVVEGPHGVEHHLVVGTGQRVDGVVVVQDLGHLAGADLDARRRAELAVAEHALEHPEDEGMGGGPVEGPGLGEQGVDALGVRALEGVAAPRCPRQHPSHVVGAPRRARAREGGPPPPRSRRRSRAATTSSTDVVALRMRPQSSRVVGEGLGPSSGRTRLGREVRPGRGCRAIAGTRPRWSARR